jgi:mono/diheme cytochrome c family protein
MAISTRLVFAGWLSLLAAGCGGGSGPRGATGDVAQTGRDGGVDGRSVGGGSATPTDAGPDAIERGMEIYETPFADGNTFACATCHALQEPTDDGLRRPGHPIGDATRRPTYKNGAVDDLRAAVNSCVTEWMNAEALSEVDPRWRLLRGLLEATASDAADPAPELTIDVVEPPSDLTGGDVAEGMTLFNRSCAVCHGPDAAGTELAPSLIGGRLVGERIARRVRLSGRADSAVYDDLTGGIMPFWASDRLSDEELLDLVAFVEEIGTVERDATQGGDDTVPEPGESGCSSDHPMVGATAELSTFAHDVAGTARVVDDCTIVLTGFTYDGGGIDVQVYGGIGGDYDPPTGFSMSDNLLGRLFDDDTLTVRLPEDRTLDDLDGVSIWCVTVGANFGDASF